MTNHSARAFRQSGRGPGAVGSLAEEPVPDDTVVHIERPDVPPAPVPRLGRGVRWSDLVAEMRRELEDRELEDREAAA